MKTKSSKKQKRLLVGFKAPNKKLHKSDVIGSPSPKNVNHWVCALRKLAYKADLRDWDNETPLTKQARTELFNKARFIDDFNAGCTPQEAFEYEMERWMDAVR